MSVGLLEFSQVLMSECTCGVQEEDRSPCVGKLEPDEARNKELVPELTKVTCMNNLVCDTGVMNDGSRSALCSVELFGYVSRKPWAYLKKRAGRKIKGLHAG